MARVYLDHASTAPLADGLKGRLDILAIDWSNPSSAYGSGQYNKYVIEKVREKVAKTINANPEEIIFTSSGSEANALAIDGYIKANIGCTAYCTNIEHSSILKNKNVKAVFNCDDKGFVYPNQFDGYERGSLFSVMMCNNEIGTYQPIKDIIEVAHKNKCLVHCDAVQVFGKKEIDVKYLDVDMMSFSGHKIGALRGVGILYVKKGVRLSPIIYGEQENGLRGSTYNDFSIKSLGVALDEINYDNSTIIEARRNYLLRLLAKNEHIILNGSFSNRAENNINIRIKNISISASQIIGLLNEQGYEISSGSACHSGDPTPSHVLKAIGLSDEDALHSLRITIGIENSVNELTEFAECLDNIIEMYKTC